MDTTVLYLLWAAQVCLDIWIVCCLWSNRNSALWLATKYGETNASIGILQAHLSTAQRALDSQSRMNDDLYHRIQSLEAQLKIHQDLVKPTLERLTAKL